MKYNCVYMGVNMAVLEEAKSSTTWFWVQPHGMAHQVSVLLLQPWTAQSHVSDKMTIEIKNKYCEQFLGLNPSK